MNQPQEHILQFLLNWDHPSGELRELAKPFNELAAAIVAQVPRNPERTVALRKLLEARDAAMRALWAKEG